MRKRAATQQFINEFKKNREEWKVQEKKKMEEENAKILEFAKKMAEREAKLENKKKEKDAMMDRVQDAVSQSHCKIYVFKS